MNIKSAMSLGNHLGRSGRREFFFQNAQNNGFLNFDFSFSSRDTVRQL